MPYGWSEVGEVDAMRQASAAHKSRLADTLNERGIAVVELEAARSEVTAADQTTEYQEAHLGDVLHARDVARLELDAARSKLTVETAEAMARAAANHQHAQEAHEVRLAVTLNESEQVRVE